MREDGTMEWYYSERGGKQILAAAESVDNIAYAIFKYITAEMASKYELSIGLKNRVLEL